MELKIINVSKSLQRRLILNNISIDMVSSRVYGIVGRNGSGKTMLFRAVSGLMNIDKGKILVDGKELHNDLAVIPNLGIVLENADLYPEYSAVENLRLLARIKNVIDDNDIFRAIERVGLDPKDNRPYRKYSLGMKQRLKIAQAVMETPDVLILDEPTNSLDEDGVAMLRKLIKEERTRGALIMIASHIRADIIALSDEVFKMNSGHLSVLNDSEIMRWSEDA